MNPSDALAYLLTIAKNAVLVAHQSGPPTGLTYEDHARVSQAENAIRAAIEPKEGDTE